MKHRPLRSSTLVLCMLLLSNSIVQAAPSLSHVEITLTQAEQNALQNSERLKAAQSEKETARLQKKSQAALRWPKLNFEATYRYTGIIPSLSFPGGTAISFGDNSNYSIGPSLNWIVWDSGTISQGVEGLRANEEAKSEDAVATARIVLLNARQAYFKVQLALEQQRLVTDSLNLAYAQYRDIENRWKAGAASKIDSLSAHKEVLSLTLQFRQTQAELSNGLRDLFSIMGEKPNFDFTYPVDPRANTRMNPILRETAAPTVVIGLEPIEKSLLKFEDLKAPSPDPSHPQIQSLTFLAQASRFSAESVSRNHWPRLNLVAKTSLDYPNGPVLEQINQNIVGLSLQWTLFDASQISHEAAAKESQATTIEHRKEQLLIDLTREWNKSQDQLLSLKFQRQILKKTIEEAEELEKLIYSSYLAGRSNFLEVQSANLRSLQSKVESARNNVQILMQLAALAQLAGKGTSP